MTDLIPSSQKHLSNLTTNSPTSSPSTHFPFLTLPSEIRNLIYATTYQLSRVRPPEYRLPDFVVHGDGPLRSKGGIQWTNIPSYPLLLVCHQTRRECLPVISPLAYFEIKTYADRDARAWNTIQVLRREAALCSGAERVLIDLTPEAARMRADHMAMRLCRRVFEMVRMLDGYERLKEITLRILASSLVEDELKGLAGFIVLTKKRGLSLLLELTLEEPAWMSRRGLREEQREYEREIQALTRRFGGKKAEVWIEWNTIKELDTVY